MDFSYKEFEGLKWNYPKEFNEYDTINTAVYLRQLDYHKKNGIQIDDAFRRLEDRTTTEYYQKVKFAQRKAMEYAEQVFPSYKFILPDALIDDWLSTVDLHKKWPTRDHSLHQSLSAYIVAKLLGFGVAKDSLELGTGEKLLDVCAQLLYDSPELEYLRQYVKNIDANFDARRDSYDITWARKVVYEASVISALFHDIGYPWQYVQNLSDSIKAANYSEVKNVVSDASATMTEIENHLLSFPFYGYEPKVVANPTQEQREHAETLLSAGLKETHGTPGALSFIWLNKELRKFGRIDSYYEASLQLILDWAAVGIMMHDMPKVYWGKKPGGNPEKAELRLDFRKDPLSCLVSLADILEEFHRPTAQFKHEKDEKGNDRVTVTYGFICKGSKITIDGGRLCITYDYQTEEERHGSADRRIQEVYEYLDPQRGYIDLSSWGIAVVQCITEVA